MRRWWGEGGRKEDGGWKRGGGEEDGKEGKGGKKRETRRIATYLMRGRGFYVTLLIECHKYYINKSISTRVKINSKINYIISKTFQFEDDVTLIEYQFNV